MRNGERCWLDPCSVALLLSPAAAGAALPFALVMAWVAGTGTEPEVGHRCLREHC